MLFRSTYLFSAALRVQFSTAKLRPACSTNIVQSIDASRPHLSRRLRSTSSTDLITAATLPSSDITLSRTRYSRCMELQDIRTEVESCKIRKIFPTPCICRQRRGFHCNSSYGSKTRIMPLPFGEGVLPPSAEASSGPNAHKNNALTRSSKK